jgi:molecular chaperone GrpE
MDLQDNTENKLIAEDKAEDKTEDKAENKAEEDIVISRKDLEKLLDSKREADKAKNELLYFQAELENFKKRQQRLMSEQVCYANEKFIRELIPVIDNFSLALKHMDDASAIENQEFKNLARGVELITKQLGDVLSRFGVEEVKSLGTQFDPNFHDAVEHREVEKCESGSIVNEFQKGYKLNGRLIRPAKVCVAKNKEQK